MKLSILIMGLAFLAAGAPVAAHAKRHSINNTDINDLLTALNDSVKDPHRLASGSPTVTIDDMTDVDDLLTDLNEILKDSERFAFGSSTVTNDDMTDTDRLLFFSSMAEFQAARNVMDPSSLFWNSNGCSYSPDHPLGFDFKPSCQRHDFGYENYKSQGRFKRGKRSIDDNFRKDLYDQCAVEGAGSLCRGVANIYYVAVRIFG